MHGWLRDGSAAASAQSPLPSVACLQSNIRNQQTAKLFQFLIQVDRHQPVQQPTPSVSSPSPASSTSLAAVREQLTLTLASTQSSIDQKQAELQQLQCAIQQQHRQVQQRQADEQERRRRTLLTQAALSKLTHKLSRTQQWNDTAQRTAVDNTTEPLPAQVACSTERLQQLCRLICEAKRAEGEIDGVRSMQPLLTALRRRHIQLAVETQRLLKEARQYDTDNAELPSLSASASTLPLLQRDIAAHRALLQYVERLQAGEGGEGVNEVKEALEKEDEEISQLKARVSESWAEAAILRRQREQMRQAWQPYIGELQTDHQQHLQPLLTWLGTSLSQQHSLMSAEWQQLHDLPLSVTHRVAVQTAAGTTSTFLLPASSSSLRAVTAPWPMLRGVLDALPGPWYQSADTLLPSLVALHIQHSIAHSSIDLHSKQLLSTLQHDRTLPGFSSLLASSAAVDSTHATSTVSLNALHASLSSLSQSAAHLSQLLQAQLQYGHLQLLPSLRVDGRDGREWMEQLSGLEAKLERQQQRARERKEAQLREAQRLSVVCGATQPAQQHRYCEDNYSKRVCDR